MQAAQAGMDGKLNHLGAGGFIVAEDQDVAGDLLRRRQAVGGDVVKGGDDRDAIPENALGAQCGASLGWQLHHHDLGRHERHGRVHHDLASDIRRDAGEAGGLGGERDGEDDDVSCRGGVLISHAGGAVAESLGGFVGGLGVAGADDDGKAGF